MTAITTSAGDLGSSALRTTVGTAVGGVIVAIGTSINPVFDAVVGKNAPAWVKAMILVAAVAAWAIVAAADLMARGRAAAAQMPQILAAPENLRAKVGAVGADPVYQIAAYKFTPATATVEYLAVKAGEPPSWKSAGTGAGQLTFID